MITQGGEGVVGIHDGEFFEFKNENKVAVESVVGAGDCFVAFFYYLGFLRFQILQKQVIFLQKQQIVLTYYLHFIKIWHFT